MYGVEWYASFNREMHYYSDDDWKVVWTITIYDGTAYQTFKTIIHGDPQCFENLFWLPYVDALNDVCLYRHESLFVKFWDEKNVMFTLVWI